MSVKVKGLDVAHWLGITPANFSNLITGRGGISSRRLLRLSDKTGISADDILRLRGGCYKGVELKRKMIDAYKRHHGIS